MTTIRTIRKTTRILVGALLLIATPLVAFAGAGGGTSASGSGSGSTQVAASPVPEPGALLLFAAGAVVVGAAIRHKRRS